MRWIALATLLLTSACYWNPRPYQPSGLAYTGMYLMNYSRPQITPVTTCQPLGRSATYRCF